MYFNTNLSVTINGQLLTSVIEVKTSNDAAKVGSSCEIKVPLNSYILYSDPNTLTQYLTAIRVDTFPQGCPVEITASYDGYPTLTIFKGFVYDFVLGMPTTIKCLDYIYFFNLGIFGDKRVSTTNKKGKITHTGTGINYKSITLQQLLQNLIDFVNTTISELTPTPIQGQIPPPNPTPVTLILPTVDLTLVNITFISMSPAAILEWIKKQIGLNMTFYNNQLYVNLASQTNGQINVTTDRNCIGSKLQTTFQGSIIIDNAKTSVQYQTAFQKIRMKAWFINSNGTRSFFEVGDQNGIAEEHFFYKVQPNGNLYETLANAALLKAQQHHYRGELELLLYPNCDLFWEINYKDARYPEKNGVFVIIGIYIELGEKGFRRKCKVAWLSSISYTNAQGQQVTS